WRFGAVRPKAGGIHPIRRFHRGRPLSWARGLTRSVQLCSHPPAATANQGFQPVTFPPTSPPLARALAERNYDQLTPVQSAVLADDAAGRDLLVSAQTGSGKTVAYGLAIAANLLGDAERLPEAAAPLALIVAPTRELALQVH